MSSQAFTIRIPAYVTEMLDHKSRWICLRVYDSDDELQTAAYRLVGEEKYGWDSVQGCFHPVLDTVPNGFLGTMRLSKEHLTSEIVIHESVHAAATFVRLASGTEPRLGFQCAKREETFAYAVGELAGRITEVLYEAKLW